MRRQTIQPPEFAWPADLMTARQVADTVLLTPKTVRQHIRRGHLRAIQLDTGPYRVRAVDAQRWVDEQLVTPDDGALALDRYLRRDGAVAVPDSGRRLPTTLDEFGARRRGRS